MRRSSICTFILGVAVVAMAGLASADLAISAQNANSSTTTTETKAKPKHRKQPAAGNAGRCDNTKEEQTDLSGTYTGKLKHGDGPAMDATLTITGNSFTMTTGSDSHSGRIMAVTTCGYTAVTVMVGDLTPPAPSPNPPAAHPAMSLRARKVGDNLTLMSVPGEPQKVMFTTTGGGAMKPKPRKPRGKTKTGAPPPAPTPTP